MKTKLQIISIALIGLIITSCSSSMNMSKSSSPSTDDIYYTPSKTTTTQVNVEQTKLADENTQPNSTNFSSLEEKYSSILASDSTNIDTVIYKAESSNPYQRILSDSYQESYERRLRGYEDPRYGMENFTTYYSNDYWYASAYDPAFYNVVVMGSQVWVEPWYVSKQFLSYSSNFRFTYGLGLGFRTWGVNSWNSYYYYNPYFGFNTWYSSWDPYYGYISPNYNYDWYQNHIANNTYFGRRPELSTNIKSHRRTETSYENEFNSSHKRGESGFSRTDNNIRTRNTNQTGITTRTGQRNTNQEITTRGSRNGDMNSTRLREGSGTTRNTHMTEPTRRTNNNTYQRPRSTNNDGYIRTGTRNQNNEATTREANNTRGNSNVREGRNTTPTYNRPSRVDSSTDRTRTTNSGSTHRETNYRESGSSNSSNSNATRSSSGTSNSTTNSNSQQNSSSGSSERRR